MPKKITPFYDLLCYLIISARGCIDEPINYGPLRLVEAASRLIDIKEPSNDLYQDIKLRLEDIQNLILSDTNFEKELDDLILNLAQIVSNVEETKEKE